jgi:hypothetical protein
MLNIYIAFTIYSLCLFPGILLAQNSVKIQSKSTVSRLENYIASAAKMGKFNGSGLIAKEGKILLQKDIDGEILQIIHAMTPPLFLKFVLLQSPSLRWSF